MISVIIPAFNDESSIRKTIAYIFANAQYKRLLKEVIVVDGGSADNTISEASKTGATILTVPGGGRAALLNCGGRQASGEILYFLQSHVLPPVNFISDIVKANSKGYAGGTFSLKFDYKHWLLGILSWFTNNASWVYLSDQSLFVTKELFDKAGGFREDHLVMVNQEMIRRIKRYTNFALIRNHIVASSRKYVRYGILRTEVVHGIVFFLQWLGYPQRILSGLYRKVLRWEIDPAPPEKRRMGKSQQVGEISRRRAVISQ